MVYSLLSPQHVSALLCHLQTVFSPSFRISYDMMGYICIICMYIAFRSEVQFAGWRYTVCNT